ncbi:MAG: hypothetical protein C4539_09880 [Ignavibacteriales bacterium]|nr:MAG: hypothetical protein C4539_09880 [Ignavibacteriales bacterium]
MMTNLKVFKYYLIFFVFINYSFIHAQSSGTYYIPVANKTIAIWPDEDTWNNNKFAPLHNKWGFSKVLINSSTPVYDRSAQYINAIAGGFDVNNLMMIIHRDNYQFVVDNFPSYYYYIGESVEHKCNGTPTVGDQLYSDAELRQISNYIKSKRPSSKLVTDGYKRCSHLIIAGGIVDEMLYSSYVNWDELNVPICNTNIPWGDDVENPWLEGSSNQSDSWRNMKLVFGSKFSMSWMHAQDDEYDALFQTATALGLKTIWLYSYDKVDSARLQIFCDAAVKAGWLQKIEPEPPFEVQTAAINISYSSSPASLKLGENITTSGNLTGSGNGTVSYKWQWKKPGSSVFEDITGSIETTTMTDGSAEITSSSGNPFTETGVYTFRIITTNPNEITSNEIQIVVELAQPDLIISSVTPDKNSYQSGEQVTINYIVTNQGNKEAGASRVGFYYSTIQNSPDNFLDFANESVLAAGASTPIRTKILTLPSSLTSGTYYIIVTADYLNEVTESNEGNNNNSSQIYVTKFEVQNIIIELTYPSIPATLKLGENITTSGTITGSGSGNVSYKWQWKKPGSLVFEDITGVIETSTMLNGSANIGSSAINPFSEVGTYTFRAITINPNSVTSNEKQVTVEIGQPDISIPTMNLNKSSVQTGEQIIINYVVSNLGNITAAASKVGFYYSTTQNSPDNFLGYADESNLTAGVSTPLRNKTVTIPTNLTAGTYYIVVVGDYPNELAEFDELNNINSRQVNVTKFEIQNVAIELTYAASPAALKLGESITTSGIITGNGNGTVNYKWQWKKPGSLTFEDITGVNESATMLNGTANLISSASNPFTEVGTYTLRIITTSPNTVTSNEKVITVELTQADLSISSFSLDKSSVQSGEQVTISYMLTNPGNGNAGTSKTGFYYSTSQTLPEYFLGYSDESALAPGTSTSTNTKIITIPNTLTTGIYYIIAVADYQNVIIESDETNNFNNAQLSVTKFLVGNITIEVNSSSNPVALIPSESITTSGTITGSGNGTVNYKWQWKKPNSAAFEDITGVVETTTIINGNAIIPSTTSNIFTSVGIYVVRIITTEPNAVASNEIQITVTAAQPDLIISTIGLDKSSIRPGEKINVSYVVENNGNSIAGVSRVGFFISATQNSTGNFIEYVNEISLNASEATPTRTKTLTIPADYSNGTYYIFVVADYLNEITESDEVNNGSSAQIIIQSTLSTISGRIIYNGTVEFGLSDCTIKLTNFTNTNSYSAVSDISGNFSLIDIPYGQYNISFVPQTNIKSVNAADALLVVRYFAGLEILDELQLLAANVNNNNLVNSGDALLILQRYLGVINEYPNNKPDWVFSFTDDIYIVNQPGQQLVIYCLSTGDVNRSMQR